MLSNSVISSIEHKMFLAIALLICCLFFTNLFTKPIAEYNESFRTVQIVKSNSNDTNERIQLSGCYPCTTPFFITMLQFQILVLPVIFFSLFKRHLGNIFFSFILSLFILLGYAGWIEHTYYTIIYLENNHTLNSHFYNYFFLDSTILDFILFLMLSVLCILQFLVLMRFVIEKFQAKMLT